MRTQVNIRRLKEANYWLKQMGVNNILKISMRDNKTYGKVYVLLEIYGENHTRTVTSSTSIDECIAAAQMIISRMGR